MRVLIFLSLIILITAGSVTAQKKSKKPVVKKPVIRATVTVKGEGNFTPTVVPNETDKGVWNLVDFPEHRLKIEFPMLSKDDLVDETFVGEAKVWSYSAETNRATYRLMVREFADITDNRDIEQTLDETVGRVYRDGHPALKVKRKIYYGNRLGMEIVSEEKGNVSAARFYILNGKLFAIYVTARSKADWLVVEPWAQKFFNSFVVQVPEANRA